MLFKNLPLRLFFFLVILKVFTPKLKADAGDTLTYSKTHLRYGYSAYNREKYDSALYWYNQVYSQDTNYASAVYEKATCYMKLEKYDEAIKAAKLSEKIKDGNTIRNSIIVARALQKLQNRADSYSIIFALKKKYPYNAELYAEQAHLAYEESDWGYAIKQLDSAFRINPYYYKIHIYNSEIAYLSGQPALAILASHFASLNLNSGDDQLALVKSMNLQSDDNFTSNYNIPSDLIGSFDELEELNQLVKSKVSFTSKYKLKLKLEEKYIRQMQLILENLEQIELGKHGALYDFYLNYYQQIAKGKLLEGCLLSGIDELGSAPAVAKLLNSKKSEIEKFKEWNNLYLVKIKKDNFQERFGFGQDMLLSYYTNGQLHSYGKVENDKKIGKWHYYHSNGELEALGDLNSESKKSAEWLYYHNNGNLSGKENYTSVENSYSYESYYRNGNKKETGNKIKGLIDGVYTEYNPNGAMKRQIDVSNGNIKGFLRRYDFNGHLNYEREVKGSGELSPYKEFHTNGKTQQVGNYKDDKLTGTIKVFYPDGKLKEVVNYDNDKRSGLSVLYYRNGIIKDSSVYNNGKLNGISKSYTEKGLLNTTLEYKNGKINGPSVWYDGTDGKEYAQLQFKNERLSSYKFLDKSGKVIFSKEESGSAIDWIRHTPYGNITEKGIYRKGEFDGEFEKYHPDGSISAKFGYVNGNFSGKYTKYHHNGKINSEVFYDVNGQRQGYQREYFVNGNIRSVGYYINGERNGLFTEYYISGIIAEESWHEENELKANTEYYTDGTRSLFYKYESGDLMEEICYNKEQNEIERLKLFAGENDLKIKGNQKYIISEGKKINGANQGPWKFYRGKNRLSAEADYINGTPEGKNVQFYSSGIKRTERFYINGSLDSTEVNYDELGNKESESYYDLGNQQGQEIYYYPNGSKQAIYYNNDDEISGLTTLLDPNGTVILERYYYNGSLVSYSGLNEKGEKVIIPFTNQTGEIITYYPNGKEALHMTMKNGARIGAYKRYSSEGKLLYHSNYSDGQLDGPYLEYHPNGQVYEETNYSMGKIEGTQKMYHSNGKLAFLGTFKSSTLHGPAEYYNQKGELLRKANFEFGYEVSE